MVAGLFRLLNAPTFPSYNCQTKINENFELVEQEIPNPDFLDEIFKDPQNFDLIFEKEFVGQKTKNELLFILSIIGKACIWKFTSYF